MSIYHLEQRLEQLNQSFWRSPIYLVDKTLMDLIYPPEKRMGININSLDSCFFYFKMAGKSVTFTGEKSIAHKIGGIAAAATSTRRKAE